ncbi:MAG: hypothetical protein AB1730_06645 [Myxococcota bacterium]
MFTQTIQHLRGELEAVSTFHTALARLAQLADERAPTAWSGPLLDEIEDAADEDGSYSRAAIDEVRKKAATALANQYRVTAATIDNLANGRQLELKTLLGSTLTAGTGDATILTNPNPAGVLSSLVRSGELRLDLAQRAVQVVKSAAPEPAPAAKKPAKAKQAAPLAKVTAALEEAGASVKKAVAKAVKQAKKRAKKVAKPAKKTTKKVAARKAPAKKPAAKKTPAARKTRR